MAGTGAGTVDELTEEATESAEAPAREAPPRDGRGPRRGPQRLVALALLIILIAGIVFAALQARTWKDDRDADRDRAHAVDVAEKVTLAMSDISFKTADEDMSSIVGLTTGELRETVLKNQKMQSEIAKKYKVESTARVEAAGVVKQTEDSAVVAVAVSSEVKNKQSKAATAHWFRVKVSVEKQSDGRWLASNVEFVQ